MEGSKTLFLYFGVLCSCFFWGQGEGKSQVFSQAIVYESFKKGAEIQVKIGRALSSVKLKGLDLRISFKKKDLARFS